MSTGACEALPAAPAVGWDDLDKSDFLVLKRIREGLYAAVFETTQAQWAKFSDDNPSQTHGELKAVDHVSYVMAKAWIAKLAEKTCEKGFDIPTNAEWDEIARDGGAGRASLPRNGGIGREARPAPPRCDEIVGLDDHVAEWTSDQYEKDPTIRHLRLNRTAGPSLNYETSVSGTDCVGFRLVLRRQ